MNCEINIFHSETWVLEQVGFAILIIEAGIRTLVGDLQEFVQSVLPSDVK